MGPLSALRWSLGFALILLGGCAGSTQQATLPAPVRHPSGTQIPADLDVVVRVDLARIRRTLEPGLALALGNLLVAPARTPETLLVAALQKTDKLWIGLRPDLRPDRWDNVIILEGDFSSISSDSLSEVFGPSRDLGGGFKGYDVPAISSRTAPARLYTDNESRWLIASEAEIDALARVVEGGKSERRAEPKARGLISVSAALRRVESSLHGKVPRAMRAFEKADSFEVSLDVVGAELDLDARIQFEDEGDAELASRALILVARWGLGDRVELSAEAAGSELAIRAKLPLELASALLAAPSRAQK